MTEEIYSSKAAKYARYRWDYVPDAVEAVYRIAGLSPASVVVDLGAGTGILSRHFAGKVARLVAVEPNGEMLSYCKEALFGIPGVQFRQVSAENSGLPDAMADLVCAGQAIHWFQPEAARAEIRRILKPSGWLALLRNAPLPSPLGEALWAIGTPENGVAVESPAPGIHTPVNFYYGPGGYQELRFSFRYQQDWPAFIGSLTSASYMPDEDHPLYPRLEAAAREIFQRFAQKDADGVPRISDEGETVVQIGQV